MGIESNVYGFIQFDRHDSDAHEVNLRCVNELPDSDEDRLLWRGMFNVSVRRDCAQGLIHFAASYDGIEYEWDYWIGQFQSILKSLQWDTATVHLDTLCSGKHTFNWEKDESCNEASFSAPQVRCQWTRESSFQ